MFKMGVKRIAVIDPEICTPKRCSSCLHFCPVNRQGKKCLYIDEEKNKVVIDENLCIGCGICVKKCVPGGIYIINLSKDLGDPIYSYGQNKFRLYGIPLPKEGPTAFIGKNGIGKTTALLILTKKLKPNFGEEKELNWEEIYQKLSVEQREYFKKIEKIKLSIKPQNIEELRKIDITVEELLKKQNIDIEKASKLFNLKAFLKRKLSVLSGGELQKTAIAIAYLKEADFYYFDEPSNYLDIEERLKTAHLLNELGERKPLIVVEHDLAIVDYTTQFCYIFFGKESVYGAISTIKHTRNGINEYLDGFLKAENLRIRDYSINFKKHTIASEIKGTPFFKYPSFSLKKGDFSLTVEGGEIKKGEVIGIVGKNALGKTLFIKSLAGLEDVKIDRALTISYKPQYIEAKNELTKNLFKDVDVETISEIRRKLEIDDNIWEKPLTSLSGGQLQRVAIALCLSKNADIYLLDEPTAFLDIEQRLALSDLLTNLMIKKEKTAFVVDHDITFIERISSRIIVFEGKPSINGKANKPMKKEEGMNYFLKTTNITVRKDKDSGRIKINKPESRLDREQKKKGKYYVG